MELTNKKAVFLGDSITQGIGVAESKNIFLNRLAHAAGLREVKNYGIGGTRIARQHIPWEEPIVDRDFCLRVEELDEDADIVVVFGGSNDYGHGDAPLGCPDDRTPDTFWGACHYLMNRLSERFIGKTVVIMTPIHRTTEVAKPEEGKASLATYVDVIKTVAAWYAIPVVDLYSTSGIQPKVPINKETYCPDGLHPNDAGHALIFNRLYSFLRNL